MVRGRHVRRSGLLVWLFATSVEPVPARLPPPSWRAVHAHSLVLLSEDVRTLREQLADLRSVSDTSTVAAGAAERRVQRLEEQLAATQAEVVALRGALAAVREELVWAYAERRVAEAPAAARPARSVLSAG